MARTEQAVAEYSRLDDNRSELQVTFALIFALVALLVLSAAVLIGLVLANQIARPVGWLILAAERVRGGDLRCGCRRSSSDDEVAGLSPRLQPHDRAARRAARRADGRLQPDRRAAAVHRDGAGRRVGRRDRAGRAGPGRAAEPGRERAAGQRPDGRRSARRWPTSCRSSRRCWPRSARSRSGRSTAEVQIGPPSRRRTLLVRIGPELRAAGRTATSSPSTTSPSCNRRSARRPGPTWRGGSRTRSRTR